MEGRNLAASLLAGPLSLGFSSHKPGGDSPLPWPGEAEWISRVSRGLSSPGMICKVKTGAAAIECV